MEVLVRPASICFIQGIQKHLPQEHGTVRDQNCAFSPHSMVRGAPKANTPVPAPILSGRPGETVPLIDPGLPLSCPISTLAGESKLAKLSRLKMLTLGVRTSRSCQKCPTQPNS